MIETIGNLTTDSLKITIPPHSLVSGFDKNHHISTSRAVSDKEINLDKTNTNTSNMNDDLRDKSTYIVPQKSNNNSLLEEENKNKNKK